MVMLFFFYENCILLSKRHTAIEEEDSIEQVIDVETKFFNPKSKNFIEKNELNEEIM